MFVLLRNSATDGRKGDKLAARWLGPYTLKKKDVIIIMGHINALAHLTQFFRKPIR